jgi:hypothetical protein
MDFTTGFGYAATFLTLPLFLAAGADPHQLRYREKHRESAKSDQEEIDHVTRTFVHLINTREPLVGNIWVCVHSGGYQPNPRTPSSAALVQFNGKVRKD